MSKAASVLAALSATALTALALSNDASAQVQPHAGMLRSPDVSKSEIVFVYADDLWLVDRAGGVARPLASPPGLEGFPRFSPDGATIAFLGNYDGNRDLYTVPVSGGVPARVTHHPSGEVMCDWTPDGKLLFFTSGLAGNPRLSQLFTVPAAGGLPEQLPVPYGAFGSISPNGEWLAYTPFTRDTATWKRYRGGMATDVWLFNLKNHASRRVTDWEGTDTQPMWHKGMLYYLSDAGDEHRMNVWSYDPANQKRRQLTRYADLDIKWPSIGPGPKNEGEVVFQHGAELVLCDLASAQTRAVEVVIPGARPTLRPRTVDVAEHVESADISPKGKRVVVEARGDVWTLPAKHGTPRNLTRTSGAAERYGSWSPDGRWIAYFSDESGEYELYTVQSDGKGERVQRTHDGQAFRGNPSWSPDSKHIVFSDKTGTLYLHTLEGGETKRVDQDAWSGDLLDPPSWSHDSRWLAYAKQDDPGHEAIWIYELETGEARRATAGVFHDAEPVFDRKGDWLYFASHRSFQPTYGDLDTTFVYAGTEVLLAVPLRAETKSPWAPESDEESFGEKKGDAAGKDAQASEEKSEDGEDEAAKDDEKDDEKEAAAEHEDDGVSGTWEGTYSGPSPLPPGENPFTMILKLKRDGSVSGSIVVEGESMSFEDGTYDPVTGAIRTEFDDPDGIRWTMTGTLKAGSIEGKSSSSVGLSVTIRAKRTQAAGEGDDEDGKSEKPRERVTIDFDGFERRALQLPVKPGSFDDLAVNHKGELLYVRRTVGEREPSASIKLVDPSDDEPEEKSVASNVAGFGLSSDGKKLLLARENLATMDASAGGTEEALDTGAMTALIDPREEWKQLFHEAWRLQRDYFYDPHMHGVDWKGVRERYEPMLADCVTRNDVSFVIREMISELNVGHAYYWGGDTGDDGPSVTVGMLGCDFALENGAYKIARIHEGAAWDSDARGPLSQPAVDVHAGDYLLAVNGVPLDTARDPWAAFQGLADRTITITVGAKPTLDGDARDVVVEALSSEADLRYRAWIEAKRAHVDERTGGKVGYVYVPDTGVEGQNDLVRQYFGQIAKPALIIDERWNGGGQIPTRFIELLNRPITNYWARRDARDLPWPPDAHHGPKCMLINGLAGSGGDAFPAYFRQSGLGKLIGTRTWGGLVGISGNPELIDGGVVTVPTFAYYEADGTWAIEGHGVDPDIEVIDDPARMVDGGDPQLDAAIDLMLQELGKHPWTPPSRPAYPDRSGMGIAEADK